MHPSTPRLRKIALTVPWSFQQAVHKPLPVVEPTQGAPQSAHWGAGVGGEENRALPPHVRPQVRTSAVLGWNALPQTAQERVSGGMARGNRKL